MVSRRCCRRFAGGLHGICRGSAGVLQGNCRTDRIIERLTASAGQKAQRGNVGAEPFLAVTPDPCMGSDHSSSGTRHTVRRERRVAIQPRIDGRIESCLRRSSSRPQRFARAHQSFFQASRPVSHGLKKRRLFSKTQHIRGFFSKSCSAQAVLITSRFVNFWHVWPRCTDAQI